MIGLVSNKASVRFLLLGAANTAWTYAVFIVLGLFLNASVAFAIAFTLGLIVVVVGSSSWVFRAGRNWGRIATFAVLYVALFAIGQVAIGLLQPHGFVELLLTSVLIASVSVPVAYFGGKRIFQDAKAPSSINDENGIN